MATALSMSATSTVRTPGDAEHDTATIAAAVAATTTVIRERTTSTKVPGMRGTARAGQPIHFGEKASAARMASDTAPAGSWARRTDAAWRSLTKPARIEESMKANNSSK